MTEAPTHKDMASRATSGRPAATTLAGAPSSPPLHQQQPPTAPSLKIAVGIATVGRPSILIELLDRLSRQLRPADAIFASAPTQCDISGASERHDGVVFIVGSRGSSHQRNAILDHLAGIDIVVFIDDDFVPAPDFLAAVEQIHIQSPEIAIATGEVLADGIHGPGLTFSDADRIIEDDAQSGQPSPSHIEVPNGYGCNMSVRLATLREHGIRFDENLPLYAWLEDVDFGVRASRHGAVVKSTSMRGVHLGVKSGRQPGRRLGYSQIANPVYLIRKGSLGLARALHLMSRNLAANCLGALRAEPWIDRRGRLAGNLLAVSHFARGRLDPQRVLEL